MTWKGERRRHSLASKGVKTGRKWKMYHGTGKSQAKQIEKHGLKKGKVHPAIYLTPDRKVAEQYGREGAIYPNTKKLDRKPVVYEVELTEEDFNKGGDPQITKIRKDNLDRAVEEGWHEYEYYYDIPKERLKEVKN